MLAYSSPSTYGSLSTDVAAGEGHDERGGLRERGVLAALGRVVVPLHVDVALERRLRVEVDRDRVAAALHLGLGCKSSK